MARNCGVSVIIRRQGQDVKLREPFYMDAARFASEGGQRTGSGCALTSGLLMARVAPGLHDMRRRDPI